MSLQPNRHSSFPTSSTRNYAGIAEKLVSNRFGTLIVAHTQKRAERNASSVQYKTNTRKIVLDFALRARFENGSRVVALTTCLMLARGASHFATAVSAQESRGD